MDDDRASTQKQLAKIGRDYYEAKHDIRKYRMFYYNADGELVEDTTRSNIKISHPFFTILADQLSAFMTSFRDNPVRAKKGAEELQEHLDAYFDAEFWGEIGELLNGAYVEGSGYLYGYKVECGRIVFECADAMGVIEVRAKDTDAGCDHIIYWYTDRIDKGHREINRIQVWDDKEVSYWVQSGNGNIEPDTDAEINPRPHVVYTDEKGQKLGSPLGFIPFWRLDNNRARGSGLAPIKGIIDDYDLHACSLSNNLKDFDTPLHVVKGFEGSSLDELQTNLKTKKMIGVGEGGDLDVRTVDIPYQARKEKLDLDREAIFTFGMGFDPARVGDGNVTNIVILSRYALLELKANKLQGRLNKLLKQLLKVVLAEINEECGTDYRPTDVTFEFTRSVMSNESENIANQKMQAETEQIRINTILNAAAEIGDDETLRMLCVEFDIDYDDLKGQLEKLQEEGVSGARKTLEGIETGD